MGFKRLKRNISNRKLPTVNNLVSINLGINVTTSTSNTSHAEEDPIRFILSFNRTFTEI